MGIVIDTSVFTVSERRRWSATRITAYLQTILPDERSVVSSVAIAEMVHGIYRAKTTVQHEEREQFVRAVLFAYPIAAFTEHTAWIAGKLRGEQAALGNSLPLGDSLIAATAVELRYAVLTHNLKDFTRIPGLRVLPFTLS